MQSKHFFRMILASGCCVWPAFSSSEMSIFRGSFPALLPNLSSLIRFGVWSLVIFVFLEIGYKNPRAMHVKAGSWYLRITIELVSVLNRKLSYFLVWNRVCQHPVSFSTSLENSLRLR